MFCFYLFAFLYLFVQVDENNITFLQFENLITELTLDQACECCCLYTELTKKKNKSY